ncbi:uncharacterized protein LOC119383828 isoform X1 [Rhipicephalus sanguineus]|uniref:uncharacterized protein LOC119383828 isoform X1 n=1 Tax=Rhipicephalus sanguineus TaxID=34632 RepID=UPI0018938ED1|nr:uncharacterized protein LOC119383828 isoform X1 [Rhipicephalus sanguineus]
MSSLPCCKLIALLIALQVTFSHGQQRNSGGSCEPMFLYTHRSPIRVGCSAKCPGGTQYTVSVRQTNVECIAIDIEDAQKMQAFLGYGCPVGRCQSDGTCKPNGLTVECWKPCPHLYGCKET